MQTPTREQITAHRGAMVHQGSPSKADLYLVELPSGRCVVKDFAGKSRRIRLLGRFLIWREALALAWLAGFDGVPRFLGRVDAHALAMEQIEGRSLIERVYKAGRAPEFVAPLRRLIDGMHERGLAHLDLRGRENLMIGPDGGLKAIDFHSAIFARPGSILHRLFLGWFEQVDEAAFLKWKARLDPQGFTDEDRAAYARLDRWRRWWPFNRKRGRPSDAADIIKGSAGGPRR